MTRFQVQWREEGGSYPTTPQADDIAVTKRAYEVRDLRRGDTYVMQVRSCNGADKENNDCSKWSVEESHIVPDSTETKLPAPTNLIVTPRTDLHAVLTWNAVSVAGVTIHHILEIRPYSDPGSAWEPLDERDANRLNQFGRTAYEINLRDFYFDANIEATNPDRQQRSG